MSPSRERLPARCLALLAAVLTGACHDRSEAAFPQGFLWGAATAAHQVEGDNRNSDWWRFEQRPGRIAKDHRSGVGVDHYRRFDADFSAAQTMGHNAHRFSIEWARIEPQPGRYDEAALRHYDAVFRSLRAHGLTPMVTLWHFTLPQWAADQGGWQNPAIRKAFAAYAALVVGRYHRFTPWWLTLNEPNVYAFHAYDKGVWPPAHHNRQEAIDVLTYLLLAHGEARKAIRRVAPEVKVGIANHLAVFDPFSAWNPLDRVQAYVVDGLFNQFALKAQVTGKLALWAPGVQRINRQEPDLQGSVDFLGVNYYTRWRQRFFGGQEQVATPGAPANDLGWELYPEGMYRTLMALKPYGLPIYITENGLADATDRYRARNLAETLRGVKQALAAGGDVRGYFHWSLLDNFEWADGYDPRFGLLAVNRDKPELTRTRRPSAAVYQRIIETGTIPDLPGP